MAPSTLFTIFSFTGRLALTYLPVNVDFCGIGSNGGIVACAKQQNVIISRVVSIRFIKNKEGESKRK